MSELYDSSSIRLFGKMIPLLTLKLNQDDESFETNLLSSSNSLGSVDSNHGVQAQPSMEDQEKHDDDDDDNGRIPLSERNSSSLESSKNEEKTETNGSEQEKTLKKPDKILPCPRCNSKDTKFCYYNNYNVNQPRHFCKNCQRYWTAGGAMRNVPVGAGRRKTKTSSPALHYHHVMIPEALNELNRNENNNSCVLTFGSNSSVFNLSPPLPQTPAVVYRPCFPASFYSPPALPALGKHSRDEIVKPSNSKAMRIDGTEIAPKSSMMAELMIKTKNSMNSGGIFNGFQSKTNFDDDRNYRMRTFSVLQANPVALSRSLNFHENA